MTSRTFLMAIILSLAAVLALPQGVLAEPVGTLTQVEGRVDLLKGGKLPATLAKVGDGVEQGDVVRTKSLSKAQITFKDNSLLTISPESRIGIEEYMFDAAKGKRSALLQLFQGMVLTAVSKIYQTEKPDFVVKTHTAIMGIRGTEVGIRLAPNSSSFLNFQGVTRVSSAFPEVPGSVDLKAMEGTEVTRGLPPTLPYEIGPEDRKLFMRHFDIANLITLKQGADAGSKASGSSSSSSVCTESAAASSCSPNSSTTKSSGGGLLSGVTGLPISATPAVLTLVATPPPVIQAPPPVTLQNYSFVELFSGSFSMSSSSPSFTTATFSFDSPGSGVRNGVYNGNFVIDTSSTSISASALKGIFNQYANGDFTAKMTTSKLTGTPGGVLTGTMRLVGTIGGGTGPPNFIFRSGTVTLQPNGDLFFKAFGRIKIGQTWGTASISWTQRPKN
jgi:hypothetical protein